MQKLKKLYQEFGIAFTYGELENDPHDHAKLVEIIDSFGPMGAGSVVNKDIPDGVVAVGNPCKVIRKITEADKKKYPIFEG